MASLSRLSRETSIRVVDEKRKIVREGTAGAPSDSPISRAASSPPSDRTSIRSTRTRSAPRPVLQHRRPKHVLQHTADITHGNEKRS